MSEGDDSVSRSGPAPPPDKPVRSLGVLLVHGIGDQRRGHTLTRFGEPLFMCLERWMKHHGGGAELSRVTVREDPTERRSPAHAIVRLWVQPTATGNQKQPAESVVTPPQETTWRLAESTWADTFERPGFGSVAFWSIRVVPWMTLTQFADRLSDALREGEVARALLGFAYLVVTFPLALLLQMLVLLLLPISLVPVLRPVVAPVQRWIAGFIGDSYVLLTSRFQFQSMVSKVQEDLEWLAERCDVIAVLAHSQGAAVAHEALRQAKPPKVELLVTFGSALARLKALRHVMDRARGMLTASSLVTMSALVVAALYLWHLRGGGSLAYAVLGVWSLGILLALAAYVMPFTLKDINELCHADQGFALAEGTAWEDYYATADPVPNGPMFAEPYHYMTRSREVYNGANVFTDHATYWRNQDEFGAAVVTSLLGLTGGRFAAGGSWFSKSDRDRRTRHRVAARLAAVVALSAAAFPHPVLGGGISIPEPLRVPLGWVAAFVNWLFSFASDLPALFGSSFRLPLERLIPKIAVPMTVVPWTIVCLAVVLLWLAASGAILRWWEALVTEDTFRSRWTWRQAYPRRAWWGAFAVLAAAWVGFWVWWIVLSPREVWTELNAKIEPLVGTAGNSWTFLVPLFVYQILNATWEAAKTTREASRERGRRLAGLLGHDLILPAEPVKPPSLMETLGDVLAEALGRLGKRRFGPRGAATVALITALASLGVVLFDFKIRGVLQAALALLALALGVLGWARAEGRWTAAAAAAGLIVGVLVMPVSAAVSAGLPTPLGVVLLTAAVVAAGCGLAGAELLRRGWKGVLSPLA